MMKSSLVMKIMSYEEAEANYDDEEAEDSTPRSSSLAMPTVEANCRLNYYSIHMKVKEEVRPQQRLQRGYALAVEVLARADPRMCMAGLYENRKTVHIRKPEQVPTDGIGCLTTLSLRTLCALFHSRVLTPKDIVGTNLRFMEQLRSTLRSILNGSALWSTVIWLKMV